MSRRLFLDNAYGILGFDASATEREIIRRSKEIDALLKIDNHPEYEYDVLSSEECRNEKAVSDASQRLMSLEKVVAENFFWFYIKDTTDKKAVKLFREKQYDDALELLKAKTTSGANSIALKNLAVFESLALSTSHTKKHLSASIRAWKNVLDSDKQWRDFEKIITLSNPNVSHENIEFFRKKAEKYLADFYSEISHDAKKPEFFAEYSRHFASSGREAIGGMIGPIIAEAKGIAAELENFKIQVYVRDGAQYIRNSKMLRQYIDALNACFYKIEQFGDNVYNSSISNAARDDAARNIRALVLRIYRALSTATDYSKSVTSFMVELLDDAYNICSNGSVIESRLEEDRNIIAYNIDNNKHRERIEGFVRNMRSGFRSLAIQYLDEILLDMSICDDFRKEIEDAREKVSPDSRREPKEYYERLAEQSGEEDDEGDEQSDDYEEYDSEDEGGEKTEPHTTIHRVNASVLGNDSKNGTGIGVAVVVFIIAAMIIIGLIVSAVNRSNSIQEAETTCNRYGLDSYYCKAEQRSKDLSCREVWSNGKQVIRCEDR